MKLLFMPFVVSYLPANHSFRWLNGVILRQIYCRRIPNQAKLAILLWKLLAICAGLQHLLDAGYKSKQAYKINTLNSIVTYFSRSRMIFPRTLRSQRVGPCDSVVPRHSCSAARSKHLNRTGQLYIRFHICVVRSRHIIIIACIQLKLRDISLHVGTLNINL